VTTTQAVTTREAATTSQAATTVTEETLHIQTDFGIPYVTRAKELGHPALIHEWAPKKPGPWPGQ
jgi:hypothetical protein